MVLVLTIFNIVFSLVVLIIAVIEYFWVGIGVTDLVGRFITCLLNIIYASVRIYTYQVYQRAHLFHFEPEIRPEELIDQMETSV